MKIRDLLDLTFREVIENYRAVVSRECGYYYGIFHDKDIDKIFEKYDIDEDYTESFAVENLICDELLVSYDDPVGGYEKLEEIVNNLEISEKNEQKEKGE